MQTANARIVMPIYQATFQYLSENCTLAILYSNRKAPVIKTALPQASLLYLQQPYDYTDSYLTTFNDGADQMRAEDVANAFTAAAPGQIKVLFSIVKQFRSYFNLGTFTGKASHLSDILYSTENEVVYGKTSKHFDIRYSFLVQKPRKNTVQKNVMISTAVTIHSYFGRLCFMLIKPFLNYMTPLLLKRAITSLEA